jgi:hypothetical protein
VILCTKCGARNPDDRRWCLRCDTFLEWDGQKIEPPAPDAPAPVAITPKRRGPVTPFVIAVLIALAVIVVAIVLIAHG